MVQELLSSVDAALRWATGLLGRQPSPSNATPRLDAELLLGLVLGLDRVALQRHRDDRLAASDASRYYELVQRRAAHEPMAYILGQRAFWDVDLAVDRRVLIPRPESEHLVEQALAWAQGRGLLRAVDVGTGSGALAIVLAQHLPQAEVWAVDISREALQVARTNLWRYNLRQRVHLVCGDLLAPLVGPFGLIVANLPYVASHELAALDADVAFFEPRLALDGGADGLAQVRRVLEQTSGDTPRLGSPGLMLLEVDCRRAGTVAAMARGRWPHATVSVHADYAGLERLVRIEITQPCPGASHAL